MKKSNQYLWNIESDVSGLKRDTYTIYTLDGFSLWAALDLEHST